MTETYSPLTINSLRVLAIDMIEQADSGHPGLPMGAAPMAYVLWQNHLRFDPQHPLWPDRDRFVLSGGHGSALLYALLHTYGYDLPMDELKRFRQWESRTPGHPEFDLTPGVEATTGPLGQGMCNAIGMAIAERALAHRFNRPDHTVVDHLTYALVTDGDLMEGVTAEAASYAGHLGLGKLICLYDSNDISLDGPTSMTWTEDVARRFEAYGWQVLTVADGDRDLASIDQALTAAKAETARPSLIVVKTTIGYGSPNKQGTSDVHGSPLGPKEAALARQTLGWPVETPFTVPDEVLTHAEAGASRGVAAHAAWNQRFHAWSLAHPDLARDWHAAMTFELTEGWEECLPSFAAGDAPATRQASGKVMNALASALPWLMGGDADLSVSTKTALSGQGSFNGQTGAGRNLHFGVREHGMGAIANGMAYHGGVRPYVSTFLVFSDYMRPAVRLAAMNGLPVVFIWTHDSVALGEDGPTHQPVEHVMSLRLIPGLTVLRPSDANETREAWRFIAEHNEGPAALILSRQGMTTLDRTRLGPAEGLHHGAYILAEATHAEAKVILIATGYEVHVALEARHLLEEAGVPTRVVSMPSWELFASQPRAYRDEVLPPGGALRVSIEAGSTLGWERWVGADGITVGVDRFGASAPWKVTMKALGLTGEAVAARVRERL